MTENKFEQLLKENLKIVSRYVGRNLSGRSQQDIEDIVQKICLATYERYRKAPQSVPEDPNEFKNYILRIAKCRCYDYYRNDYRTKDHKEDTPIEELNIKDTTTDMADTVEQQLMIEQVLAKLKTIHSEVIRYRCLLGYSEEKTASILNISKGTVKSRFNAAKKHFIAIYNSTELSG